MEIGEEIYKIKKGIIMVADDLIASRRLRKARNNEINKFRDPRRIKIANQFPLTREQKDQIDDFYISNYGTRIDYVWHQNYAAHAGRFDFRFFPELLYIPEFEAFQNQNYSAIHLISDKNFLPIIAKSVGVTMPKTIFSCTNGVLRDNENHFINYTDAFELLRKEPFFIKPSIDSCSGQGCYLSSSIDSLTFDNKSLRINGNFYSNDFVVQEVLTCHESIRSLYAGSVNTFRIVSFLWREKIEVAPVVIRIGQQGNYLDNAHAGGMFCAVYPDGSMGDYAVTEFNDRYNEHPVSHIIFAKHKIAYIDKVIKAAKQMHSAIPQIGVINWDFTINEKGDAILIEANVAGGCCWMSQMAHGTAFFGEKTAEVLQWLRFMKTLKAHQRKQFSYGKMM